MMDFLQFVIDNIYIISVAIILICIILLFTLRNTVKFIGKAILIAIISITLLINLGYVSSDRLKDYAKTLPKKFEQISEKGYADYINDNSTAEQFIK